MTIPGITIIWFGLYASVYLLCDVVGKFAMCERRPVVIKQSGINLWFTLSVDQC